MSSVIGVDALLARRHASDCSTILSSTYRASAARG